ncbi:CYTH and CHAD domain-containing protein [Psychrobacter sp. B38]|uniref:CYTH and CHAD domain-containing protein n=1 Tax=Psychrobacter sp. B38 TaxID=3143538 RepID=UPI00320D9522
MQEIELKFLVPESRLKGLMRQTHVKSSQVMQLAAHYYDTDDQKLAKAGIGLRIRKEGDNWVQTIKAGGDGIVARLEHNALLDNEHVQTMLDNNALIPDLTIYQDTPIAAILDDFKIKKLSNQLTPLYVTDVQRTTRLLVDKTSNDSDYGSGNLPENKIEVAYDQGQIIHGNDHTQRDTIQEIEFELISGDVDFLFTTAKTWCKRYKLCLSTVTKAERGGLLIKEQRYSQAVGADLSQMSIHKKMSKPAFVRAAVHNCLLQILPNSSAIVAGSTDHEHILQFQTGIKRLLTAITAFADFSDEINPDWQPILQQTTALLDDYRELTYLANHVEAELQAYDSPATDWTTDIKLLKISPMDAVKANDFQLTLLELIAFTMSDPELEPQGNERTIDKLTQILSEQYERLIDLDSVKEADSIDSLYNQLERLRYVSEFCAPLFGKKSSKKKAKRRLKHLVKAHKALKKYHAHTQYHQRYVLKAGTESNALYGTGWFAAMLEKEDKGIQKRLDKVKESAI